MPAGTLTTICRFTLPAALVLLAGCLAEETPGGSDLALAPNDGSTANNPPTISGSPVSAVLVGDVYLFQPAANDPDGDSLSFTIQNKPRWASFDPATGRLSGQTALGDAGEYTGIRISVSDGNASRALPGFSLTVSQSANGAMELSWEPPTENTDGSDLTNLAGYNIYYGPSLGNYPKSVRLDNPSITTYLVENLLPGTYYVVATSFNTAGVESEFSAVAIKRATAN